MSIRALVLGGRAFRHGLGVHSDMRSARKGRSVGERDGAGHGHVHRCVHRCVHREVCLAIAAHRHVCGHASRSVAGPESHDLFLKRDRNRSPTCFEKGPNRSPVQCVG